MNGLPLPKSSEDFPDNPEYECPKLVEKAREFDPFGHAGFDPTGIIRLTP